MSRQLECATQTRKTPSRLAESCRNLRFATWQNAKSPTGSQSSPVIFSSDQGPEPRRETWETSFPPMPTRSRKEKGKRQETGERIGGAEVSHGSQTHRRPWQIEQEPGDTREPKRPFGRLLALEAMPGEGGLVSKKRHELGTSPVHAPQLQSAGLHLQRARSQRSGPPEALPRQVKKTRVGHEFIGKRRWRWKP